MAASGTSDALTLRMLGQLLDPSKCTLMNLTDADSPIQLADRVRMLRFHGSADKEHFEMVGYNSRLDAIQAAVLRVQLPHLDAWSDARRAVAARYADAGLGELVPVVGPIMAAVPALIAGWAISTETMFVSTVTSADTRLLTGSTQSRTAVSRSSLITL